MEAKLIRINSAATEGKGQLSFFESQKDVPFEIKRIYYIYDVNNNVTRGCHAHKELQQLLFCPYGAILITLDDGNEKMKVSLDDPSKGLLLGANIWREMTWKTDGAVLVVAASAFYDENDYIRDYHEFIKYLMEGE